MPKLVEFFEIDTVFSIHQNPLPLIYYVLLSLFLLKSASDLFKSSILLAESVIDPHCLPLIGPSLEYTS